MSVWDRLIGILHPETTTLYNPCKHCNNTHTVLRRTGSVASYTYYVYCTQCKMKGRGFTSQLAARNYWNKENK